MDSNMMISTAARRMAVTANRSLRVFPSGRTLRFDADGIAHTRPARQRSTIAVDLAVEGRLSVRRAQELLDELARRGPAARWWDEIERRSASMAGTVRLLGRPEAA